MTSSSWRRVNRSTLRPFTACISLPPVRPFKLETDDQLRKLDPNDIDRMVSIKGMVTRTSQARGRTLASRTCCVAVGGQARARQAAALQCGAAADGACTMPAPSPASRAHIVRQSPPYPAAPHLS
eukprot:3171453-Prymnesium_polylepis.1